MKNLPEQSRAASWVVKLGNGIEKTTGLFCVILFAMMVLAALMGVFFRYVMQNPFQWTEEVARYFLIWLSFTAISMGIWRGEHISIPFLVQRIPKFLIKWLVLLTNTLITLFLVTLLIKGWQMTVNTMMTAQSMPVSMFWFYLAVPVSAMLSLVQVVLSVARVFLSPLTPSVPAKE